MKRLVLLLTPLLFPLSMAEAQNVQSVSLSYSSDDFEVITEGGISYIQSSSYSLTESEDTLAPALPLIDAYVLIGPNDVYSNHTVATSEILAMSYVMMAPNTLPSTTLSNSVPSQNRQIYYASRSFPDAIVEYTGTHVSGGYKFLSFLVSPFRYDATTKKLYLNTSVNINISLTTQSSNISSPSPYSRASIQRLVVNNQDIDIKYAPANPSRLVSIVSPTNDMHYEYLIITCDSLKDEFQRLAVWKTTKGVRTKVMTVEEIYANTPGNRPQLKIKQAIKDLYDASGHSLQYVLIGGDHDIVPAELCYIKAYDSGERVWIERNVACNLFYGSFSNMDWDTNGNGKVGEIEDNINLAYDVVVTRLSVVNSADARTQIERIINYEACPNDDGWEDKILLCGTRLGKRYYYDGVYMSDTHYKTENIFYKNYIQDKWEGTRYMLYDTGSSFDGGADYNFNLWNFNDQLTNKYTFVNVVTHGGFDRWKLEYQSGTPVWYESQNADTIKNQGSTIIETEACLTNDYCEESACLSESFMRNPNGGIIAYYGSSKEGWYSPTQFIEGPSAAYNGAFYRQLLTEGHHQLGRAVYDSKQEKIGLCASNASRRWLMMSLNLMGDPEMPVFLSVPERFNNILIGRENGILSVSTGVPDCRICVTSRNDGGETYYVMVDSVQNQVFNIDSDGCYSICVTKQGYVPYVVVSALDQYIQNETLNSDQCIWTNNVYIGQNVTSSKPQGPVGIVNGKTEIHFKQDAVITGGVEVSVGAE